MVCCMFPNLGADREFRNLSDPLELYFYNYRNANVSSHLVSPSFHKTDNIRFQIQLVVFSFGLGISSLYLYPTKILIFFSYALQILVSSQSLRNRSRRSYGLAIRSCTPTGSPSRILLESKQSKQLSFFDIEFGESCLLKSISTIFFVAHFLVCFEFTFESQKDI